MSARGGDPAAMLASGAGHERVGLTEMLRNAPPAEDSGLEMTKIRAAPRVASAAAATPKPTPASAAAAAAATSLFAANSPAAEAWLRQLASGLGLAPEALAGCDPAQAAERAGAVARAAVAVLQRWLQQQPGGAPTGAGLALSADELALLRQAHTPEAALLALMAARPAGAKP
jgi:predicted component of type VI protein secretion system